MLFKRNEAFRYTFKEPIEIYFRIIMIDELPLASSAGKAQMLDVSPEGARLSTDSLLHEEEHSVISLAIDFKLEDTDFSVTGDIVWHKQVISAFEYGVHFSIDDDEKQQLICALKKHVKT